METPISCKISLMVSVDIKHHVYLLMTYSRVHEMCESQGGRPGLPVPNISNINKIQDYYLTREMKTWLNINHITVRNNVYF